MNEKIAFKTFPLYPVTIDKHDLQYDPQQYMYSVGPQCISLEETINHTITNKLTTCNYNPLHPQWDKRQS